MSGVFMADDAAAVADSGLPAAAAPSEAAAQPADATHGDTATEQATPTPPADNNTPSADTGDPDSEESDDEDESSSDESQTEEQKTAAQKRRERRQRKEEDRIAAAVQERLDQAERAREAKATQDAAEAKQRQAAESWAKEFGSLVGTPDVHESLNAEISSLTAEIANLRPYADGTDLDVLEQKQTALTHKLAERDDLKRNADLYDKIDKYQFTMTQNQYAAMAASLPPEHAREYLKATDVPTALKRLEVGIVAREAAKHAADKAAAVKAVTAELERERAEHAATRTGGPGAGPVPATGGTGSSSAVYTRERLATMTTAEYRANKAEIERQEAAGLIR